MSGHSEKYNPVTHLNISFDEQRRLASCHLNRITSLQEELETEGARLRKLVKQYGLGVFSCDLR